MKTLKAANKKFAAKKGANAKDKKAKKK